MIGILAFSFICAYFLIRFLIIVINHAKRRKEFAHLPQKHTTFLLGETSFFKLNPITYHFIQALNKIANEFVNKDKLFMTWMTIQPAVFIFNKDYIKKLLSKNDPEMLTKGNWLYSSVDDIVHDSLLTVPGDKWKIRRKILSSPFQQTNLDNFMNVVNFESMRLVNHLKKNPCKDTIHQMKKFTLTIFCKLLFEYDVDDEIEEVVRLASKTTDILVRKSFGIFLVSPALYRFTSLATEEAQMLKDLMIFKNKMLSAKTESSKQNLIKKLETQNDPDGKSNSLTLIEILLKNFKNTIKEKSAQWSGFEMEEIRAQLDVFIVAGLDTLSVALTFFLHHLARYPEYQEQIYEEIQQLIGRDRKQELTMEEVKKLVFLEAFINESLRIQPIVPLISRQLTNEIELDDKYTVPANTDIVIFIEKVLKDPEYFPEPDVFKPERFLDDQKDNLYVNIPFSGGSRNCVAKRFSLYIMQLFAVDLIRNFKIQLGPSTPKEITRSMIKFELVNKPIDAIELQFVERC